MSTRDNRGRFVNADTAAAERVLEAGVLEAIRLMRSGLYLMPVRAGDGRLIRMLKGVESDHRHLATRVLENAGHAAALLLDERPAKKAAARRGAS